MGERSSNLAPLSAEGDAKLKEHDRLRYQNEAASLGKKMGETLSSTSGADEQAVWEVYARTEKLIAVLKFRLDYETPGVFTVLPEAGNALELLEEARILLSRAAEEISARRLVEAVETLRKARNNMRSYLTDKRKSAVKSIKRSRSGKTAAP